MPDRRSWIDETGNETLIDDYANKLEDFLVAMADGSVDEQELSEQESRVVELMKDVEPLLDDETHEKMTRLMCELSAFNVMQFAYQLEQVRPKTVFRG